MKNNYQKRGLSTVISVLLIILLAFVVTTIVWGVVKGIVDENTQQSEACFDSFGKITINDFYTCYNPSTDELKFGIERKNFDLDAILVSFYSGGESITIEIPADVPRGDIEVLKNSSEGNNIIAPGKNSGSSYYLWLNRTSFSIDINNIDEASIKIAPVVDEYNCEVSDTLYIIETC